MRWRTKKQSHRLQQDVFSVCQINHCGHTEGFFLSKFGQVSSFSTVTKPTVAASERCIVLHDSGMCSSWVSCGRCSSAPVPRQTEVMIPVERVFRQPTCERIVLNPSHARTNKTVDASRDLLIVQETPASQTQCLFLRRFSQRVARLILSNGDCCPDF